MAKKVTKKDREDVIYKQINAQPMNIFLTKMFFKASFRAWHSYMTHECQREEFEEYVKQEKNKAELLNKEFVPPKFEQDTIPLQEVEILKEIEEDLSCNTDEEFSDYDTKSKKSYNTLRYQSEFDRRTSTFLSPEVFRMKARSRMQSSYRKIGDMMDSVEYEDRSKQVNTDAKIGIARKKSMMIVHSPEEAAAQQNYQYVDPNSQAYTNVILENKFAKAERNIKRM